MKKLLVILSLISATGCATETYLHGYTFEQSDIDFIAIHKSTRDDVIRELGSPTSKSNFGDSTYYYINFKTEKTAFFDPKVVEQKVLAITFNKKDQVSKIIQHTLDDRNQIAFSEDKTEIQGNYMTPAEQMLSNIGKFNKKK